MTSVSAILLEPASRPKRRSRAALLQFALPLAFAAVILAIGFISNAFEYDTDEGRNLMKAMLFRHGHTLYSEVWADQPPIFTYALAGMIKFFGPSVLAPRCVVLVFSVLLLWATCSIVRSYEDDLTAALAVLFLAASGWYAKLSFSVMIGLPSMAMAVVALCLLVHFRRTGRRLLLVLSALAMGISLQIKVSSITALPAFLMVMFMRMPDGNGPPVRRSLVRLAIWIAIVAAFCAMIIIVSGQTFDLIIASHRQIAREEGLKAKVQFLELMKRDPDLLLLALVMALFIVPLFGKPRGYRLRQMLPLIWLALPVVAVQFHAPVWYHHILLMVVPFCWSAANGMRPLMTHARRMLSGCRGRWGETDETTYSIPSVIIVALVAGFFCYKVPSRAIRLLDGDRDTWALVQQIRTKPNTGYVLTDGLMYAYRAGVLSCPTFAAGIGKREPANRDRDAATLAELKRFRPGQVIIGRRQYGPDVMEYILRNYKLSATEEIDTKGKNPRVFYQYIRNDLVSAQARSRFGAPAPYHG